MIYNGIDISIFQAHQGEPHRDPFKLLAIGSIYEIKDPLSLVRALVILRNQYKICPIVSWVGRVSDEAYFRIVKQAIENAQLKEQWNWLNNRNDISQLLEGAHALVHPSTLEGLPNVVCEALACGRPVIASNIYDHPRLIQNGKYGFLFESKNPEDLADKIRRLYDMSSSQRHEMGKCGRMFAESHLSLEHLINRYDQLFMRYTKNDEE